MSVYKGQWFHGKRHGLGKHYSAQKVFYYGYWENDMPGPRGQLVKYSDDWRKIMFYNGEFQKGKKHGEGELGWINKATSSNYSYQGRFKNDLKHGLGVEKGLNGEEFKGSFTEGLRDGKGELKFPSGTKYGGLRNINL